MAVCSLNLQHDFRDDDAVDALEFVFGITFEAEETASWLTVGDVEDAVVSRFQNSEGGKCLSLMAFYRVRRALDAGGSPQGVPPSLLLADLPAAARRKFLDILTAQSGLEAPAFRTLSSELAVWSFSISVVLMIFAAVTASYAGFFAAIGCLAFSITAQIIASKSFPFGMTVADLTRAVTDWNVARLAAIGGKVDKLTARRATRRVLASVSEKRLRDVRRETWLCG